MSTSEAQLLAPQEIMGEERARARGELTGAEERTETDRKRERRKKKAKQGAIARWVSGGANRHAGVSMNPSRKKSLTRGAPEIGREIRLHLQFCMHLRSGAAYALGSSRALSEAICPQASYLH